MKAIRERIDPAHRLPSEMQERYYIFCPACNEVYKQRYPDNEKFWDNGALHCFSATIHQFNGDMDRPTISQSLLCTYTNNTTGEKSVCHSFVKDGRIQYLGDCTHRYAGQTVDLMDVPQDFIDEMTTADDTKGH